MRFIRSFALLAGWHRFRRDDSGAAMIEATFATLMLGIMMYGIFEVSSFIRARDHVNKVADQIAELMSTTPLWPQELVNARASSPDMDALDTEINRLLRIVPAEMSGHYGVKVHVLFCDGLTNSDGSTTQYQFEQVHNNADCSRGFYPAEAELIGRNEISCANIVDSAGKRYGLIESRESLQKGQDTSDKVSITSMQGQPGQQFVAVYAGCSYRPWASVLSGETVSGPQSEEIEPGSLIERVTIIPMRNHMKWAY